MQKSSKGRWARAIINRLTELVIVFVGVYAAFVLNAHQIHQREQQRRLQVLSYLEKGATTGAEKLKQATAIYDRNTNRFLDQLAKGEMPEITAISWASSYNPNESAWLLQAGGFRILGHRDDRANAGTGRCGEHRSRHDGALPKQLSDQLIAPHLGEVRSFFYDPTTKQLRKEYAQYPEILKEGSRVLRDIAEKTGQLAAQLRAEQRQHR